MIEFIVYGAPVSQPRQRHRVVHAGNGRVFATNYTPKNDPVQSWKTFVRDAAQKAGAELIEGPVRMSVIFYLPRPQSLCRNKDPEGAIVHAGAKDWDNLGKAVADCLIGICYQDDKQIADARIQKFYHEKSAGPRAHVVLEGIS